LVRVDAVFAGVRPAPPPPASELTTDVYITY
jgi:hypothetical protein